MSSSPGSPPHSPHPASIAAVPVEPAPAGAPGGVIVTPHAGREESEWRVGTLAYNRRGLAHLFSWLLWGDFAWSVRDRSLGDVLKLILRSYKASDTLSSLLSSVLPSIIGFILGPIVSFRSDRFRSRWGRRIPFLLFSAPAAAVSIILLGFSPSLGRGLDHLLGPHSPGPYASVLVVLAFWWVIFDFSTAVTNSVFHALINDTVPHGVIGRFYALFRMVSLAVGAALNFWLLARAADHPDLLFLAVGAIYGIGVVAMCLMVREGDYPPPSPAPAGKPLGRFLISASGYFKECFSHPYYRSYFVAFSLANAATAPVNLYSIYFAGSIGLSKKAYFECIGATYSISFCITYLLGVLVDRFHPLRLSMVVIALYGLTCVWGGIYARTPELFAAALIIHGVFSGMFFTTSAGLGQRMLPQARFAQFASAGGLVGAVIGIVLPTLLGLTLDATHHAYRLTFYVGAVLSLVGFICLTVVYSFWRKYGGPHHFVPPA